MKYGSSVLLTEQSHDDQW